MLPAGEADAVLVWRGHPLGVAAGGPDPASVRINWTGNA